MRKPTSFIILGTLLGIFTVGAYFAWSGQNRSQAAGGVRTLKIAHALPTNHPVHQGLKELKRRTEALSGGKMKVTIFPSEQLGNEIQCLEKIQSGSLDITKVSAAAIGNFVPAYRVFSLPYLFRDEEHYWKTLEGPVGLEMLKVLEKRGDGSSSNLHGLGYFDSGSRNFYTVDPVRTPADLAGKKIRVMNDEVAMDMVQAMGGSPTPIAFGELYTALKQGTVDGAENNPPSFVSSRHYEICKHYVMDHHSRIPDLIVMSLEVWNKLSSQEQQWLTQAMSDASHFQRELWQVETENSLKQLQAEGVTIYHTDLAPFRAASLSVIEKHSDTATSPLIEKIRAVR